MDLARLHYDNIICYLILLYKTKLIIIFYRTPNMRLKTILITLSWFANETVYLGLSYYGPSLGNDQYFSFFLSAAVELPSYICCWYLMDTFGRRWPLSLSMILG